MAGIFRRHRVWNSSVHGAENGGDAMSNLGYALTVIAVIFAAGIWTAVIAGRWH